MATVTLQVLPDGTPTPTPTVTPTPTTPTPTTTPVANRAPIAVADAYSTRGRLQVLVEAGVLANDADALIANLQSSPTHGTLSFQAGGSFVYTPAVATRAATRSPT